MPQRHHVPTRNAPQSCWYALLSQHESNPGQPWTTIQLAPNHTYIAWYNNHSKFPGYVLKTCQSKLSSYSLARRNTPKQDAHEPSTAANVPDTVHSTNASNRDKHEKNVVFSAYPLQTTAWDKLGYGMQDARSSLHPRRKQPASRIISTFPNNSKKLEPQVQSIPEMYTYILWKLAFSIHEFM